MEELLKELPQWVKVILVGGAVGTAIIAIAGALHILTKLVRRVFKIARDYRGLMSVDVKAESLDETVSQGWFVFRFAKRTLIQTSALAGFFIGFWIILTIFRASSFITIAGFLALGSTVLVSIFLHIWLISHQALLIVLLIKENAQPNAALAQLPDQSPPEDPVEPLKESVQ